MSMNRLRLVCVVLAVAGLAAGSCWGSAFVKGAYYRLGEDDAGAVAGAIGNDPTVDSFADHLDLARHGSPRYSADISPWAPYGSKLSMAFANEGLGGPAFPGFYGRGESLSMVEQGMALEAWVKAGPSDLDSIANWLVAYNGDPASNGFGLFLHADKYVARVGNFERELGPADVGTWHHIAYIQTSGSSAYYYDGKLVAESDKDPVPTAGTGGFWIGAQAGLGGEPLYAFNGWIDEVRYQTFNPLAAGSFNPAAFLVVPEPTGMALLALGAAMVLGRRCRRSRG